MTGPSYKSVLRALELHGARLSAGPGARGPAFAYGGADGQLRGEAWAFCPACTLYGLRVDRREDGSCSLACRARCSQSAIVAALAGSVTGRTAA